MFEKLLLAVDGSPGSEKAVGIAAGLAKNLGSEVLVFHVREIEIGRFSGQMEPPEEALELVNRVVSTLQEQGVVVKGEARSAPLGRAGREIVEGAAAAEVDGIVLGSRGLSDWSALLLGSVAHKVISLAHCPVIVAR
ncbi:MAG TPA: universal stress protein [Actinomycetota bacterium]|jgi:nucleotide-binding universal stress UspA family protein